MKDVASMNKSVITIVNCCSCLFPALAIAVLAVFILPETIPTTRVTVAEEACV